MKLVSVQLGAHIHLEPLRSPSLPRRGQVTGKLRSDRSSAQRYFATMLRQLRELLADLSLEEIANLVHVQGSTLSGYLNAVRLPSLQTATKLYEMARERATAAGIAMPYSQEQLDAAHRNAQIRLCRSCPARIAMARSEPVTVPGRVHDRGV